MTTPLSIAELRLVRALAANRESPTMPVTAERLVLTCDALIELHALAEKYASECGECGGTGLVTIKTWPGGIEVDNDDQPCPDCADIRAAIAKVKP